MKDKIILFFLFACFLLFSPGISLGYSELDGRWIELHGPYCWQTLGVALDEEVCDLLRDASLALDKKKFSDVLAMFRVLRIEKNTKVVVLEMKISEDKAKVLLLTGLYKGQTGWVPLEWLQGNEKRPLLREYEPKSKSPLS